MLLQVRPLVRQLFWFDLKCNWVGERGGCQSVGLVIQDLEKRSRQAPDGVHIHIEESTHQAPTSAMANIALRRGGSKVFIPRWQTDTAPMRRAGPGGMAMKQTRLLT